MDDQDDVRYRLSAPEFWAEIVQHRVAHIQIMAQHDKAKALVRTRQMIDKELAAMHQALCSLRVHRNTLAPMFSLPPELLTRILRMHAVNQPLSNHELGWIRMTHVCKSWRDIALHDPSLWSDISNQLGPRWVELMLTRTQSVPLSYRFSSVHRPGHVRENLLPHLHRVRSLSVLGHHDYIIPLLKAPAPIFDTLILDAEYRRLRLTILPEGIFGGAPPMLRQLYLNNICISWSAPIFRGLTHLRLKQQIGERQPFEHEDEIFSALNGMSALEVLHLENVLPIEHRVVEGQGAQLPCLRSLLISDKGYSCLNVFSQLHIPSSCRIRIHCATLGMRDMHALDAQFPRRLCRLFRPTPDPFHTLSIVHASTYPEGYRGLNLWRKSNIPDSKALYLPHGCDLSLTMDRAWPVELLTVACDTLPLKDVRVIFNDWAGMGDRRYKWQPLFANNCSEVSSILVNNEVDAIELCKALALTLDDPTNPEEGAQQALPAHDRLLLFPHLKLLEFRFVDIGPRMIPRNRINAPADSLLKALDIRRTSGSALSLVRLEGCIIDAERLNALREIVDVEWNPDTFQEIPKAPKGRVEGFMHTL